MAQEKTSQAGQSPLTTSSSVAQPERDPRLRFMGIDSDTSFLLSEFWPRIEPELSDIVEGFYQNLTSVPSPNNPVIADAKGIKTALRAHWERLFSGKVVDSHLDSVPAIVQIDREIGPDPKSYLGGYNFVQGRLTAIALGKSEWPSAKIQAIIAAVNSMIALDMDFAISVHVASQIAQDRIRHRNFIADVAQQETPRLLAALTIAIYSGVLELGGALTGFTITDSAERLTGWGAAEFSAWKVWAQKAKAIDDTAWNAHFAKVVANGKSSIEYDIVHKSGATIRVRDHAKMIGRLDDGRIEIAGYISDITQDHTVRTQAVTSAKLATLGQMASGLAHEINQPFAIMSLAAENSAKMLQERGPDGIGYTIDRLHRIRDQAARARTIIDHLRIFGGQGGDAKTPVSLTEAVDGAFAAVGDALRAARIAVVNELDESLPPVLGRLVLVQQVIVNLTLNALDAMEKNDEGSARLTLRSSTDNGAGTVSLSVSDTGPGIPAAIRERLFDPFFTTKDVGKGIGLGLSICHGIMTSFGGSIAVDEAPEGGAVFTVTFRKAPAAPN
jgi:signal transduction histidine kinase